PCGVQKTALVIVAQIVTQRGKAGLRAEDVVSVRAVQNGVPDRKRTIVVDAVTLGVDGDIAVEGAAGDRRAAATVVVDATASAVVGEVVADGAVIDRKRTVVADGATKLVVVVTADRAVPDRKRTVV